MINSEGHYISAHPYTKKIINQEILNKGPN